MLCKESARSNKSDVHEDAGLVGVLHLFDTEDGAVDLVVNPGKVGDGGALTDSAELVIHGTVAEADPALVGTEVRHRDAAEMSANGGAAHDRRVAGVRDGSLRLLIKLSGGGESVGLVDLRLGQTSDEDEITVPRGLKNLTRGQLRDVELLVGITDVPVTGDHLVVKHGDEGLNTEDVVAEDEALDHVELSTADLVVTVLLIPDSVESKIVSQSARHLPVLIEPVVSLGLGIERITKVARARRCNPVHGAVRQEEVVRELLVAALVVLLHDAEITACDHCRHETQLSFDSD